MIELNHGIRKNYSQEDVSMTIAGAFAHGQVDLTRLYCEGKYWGWRFEFSFIETLDFCTGDKLEIKHVVSVQLRHKNKLYRRLQNAFKQAYIKYGSPKLALCEKLLDL